MALAFGDHVLIIKYISGNLIKYPSIAERKTAADKSNIPTIILHN